MPEYLQAAPTAVVEGSDGMPWYTSACEAGLQLDQDIAPGQKEWDELMAVLTDDPEIAAVANMPLELDIPDVLAPSEGACNFEMSGWFAACRSA